MDDPLYLQIAERLARSIRAGTLQRGERMPSVRVLAGREGVSQSTAVQALRWLEDARLIEARPRSGYFVAARPPRLPEPETSRPETASRRVELDQLGQQVLRLSTTPGIISFGAACPGPELFDQDRVRRALGRAVQRHAELLCTYPAGPGMEEARRAIARHALGLGCTLHADQVLITNSCMESISLCLKSVTRPGDVVALESPTYYGFLESCRACICARWRSPPILATACPSTPCSWPCRPSPASRPCWPCPRSPTPWAPACRRPNAAAWPAWWPSMMWP